MNGHQKTWCSVDHADDHAVRPRAEGRWQAWWFIPSHGAVRFFLNTVMVHGIPSHHHTVLLLAAVMVPLQCRYVHYRG